MAGHCSKQDAQYDSEERGGKRFKQSFSSNDLSSDKSIKDQANVITGVSAETGGTVNLPGSILNINVIQQTSDGNKPENVQDIEKVFKDAVTACNKVACDTQENVMLKLDALLPAGSKEKFTKMGECLSYFIKKGDLTKVEYTAKMLRHTKEIALTFEDPLERSIKSIIYEGLMELIMDPTPNHVALVGPSGSGKTTLMKKICRDLSSSDKLIAFLNFRDLHSDKNVTPFELLFGNLSLKKSVRDQCSDWLQKNQEKVIFLFDGLDQARWEVNSEAKPVDKYSKSNAFEIISNILSRKLFPKSKIVYSSREHSVSSLEDSLRPDKVITLLGFSHDDAMYLFTHAIIENGQNLWNKMEPSLKALLTIPAFLTFSVYVYERNLDSQPTSMTNVMQKLFYIFLHSDNVRNKNVNKILHKLRKLSYIGLSKKKVSFYILDFDEVDLNLDEVRDFVIIVPGVSLPTFRLFEGDYVITFSHQSIQEFFAAEYIVRMEIDSFKKVVDEDLRKDYWSVVTRFVSGLLLNGTSKFEESGILNCAEKQEILKTMLTSEYARREFSSDASTLSILASIAETEDSNFIRSTVMKISLHRLPIGVSGMSAIASIVRRCENLEKIILSNCGLDIDTAQFLWENIKHHHVKVDEMVVAFNRELGDGFQYICKVAARCEVRILNAKACKLQSSQLSWIKEMKPSQLNELNLHLNEACDACLEDIGTIMNDCGKLIVDVTGKNGLQPLERAMKNKKLQDLFFYFTNETSTTGGERPKVPDTCFATASIIIVNRGSITLRNVDATYSGLNSLKLALDKKEISHLNLCRCDIHADGMAVVGQIAKRSSVGKLGIIDCNLDVSGINRMLTGLNHTTISEVHLLRSRIASASVVTNQIKQCSIKNLNMRSCKLDASALRGLFSAVNGVKISELNLAYNDFDGDCCETIGNIVKQCSVDELDVSFCGITDDTLHRFLDTARKVKLTKLDLKRNRLSSAAIEKIKESITVEELKGADDSDSDSSDGI